MSKIFLSSQNIRRYRKLKKQNNIVTVSPCPVFRLESLCTERMQSKMRSAALEKDPLECAVTCFLLVFTKGTGRCVSVQMHCGNENTQTFLGLLDTGQSQHLFLETQKAIVSIGLQGWKLRGASVLVLSHCGVLAHTVWLCPQFYL